MPLEPIPELLSDAQRHDYAVGYFESWDITSLQGVIDAAEVNRSPIIIGFSGEFLSRPERQAAENLSWYGALGKAAAESAGVPCGFIFNECPIDDWVRRAVTAGFNLVMPADPAARHEDYLRRVADITAYAHHHNVAVEAEVGELPMGSTGKVASGGSTTDATAAAKFVAATGIDLLAVSVGNVHILIRGQKALDLDNLSAIHKQVSIPLVLHGGTGIDEISLRKAISMGVAKINYGTILKQRYLAAVRPALENPDQNPHHLLGYGENDDVLVRGRRAVMDAVTEKIDIIGSKNRA